VCVFRLVFPAVLVLYMVLDILAIGEVTQVLENTTMQWYTTVVSLSVTPFQIANVENIFLMVYSLQRQLTWCLNPL